MAKLYQIGVIQDSAMDDEKTAEIENCILIILRDTNYLKIKVLAGSEVC